MENKGLPSQESPEREYLDPTQSIIDQPEIWNLIGDEENEEALLPEDFFTDNQHFARFLWEINKAKTPDRISYGNKGAINRSTVNEKYYSASTHGGKIPRREWKKVWEFYHAEEGLGKEIRDYFQEYWFEQEMHTQRYRNDGTPKADQNLTQIPTLATFIKDRIANPPKRVEDYQLPEDHYERAKWLGLNADVPEEETKNTLREKLDSRNKSRARRDYRTRDQIDSGE